MDLYTLLQWMMSRDDAARAEREEDAARHRAEVAAVRAEREEQRHEDSASFDALLSKLASPGALSSPPPISPLDRLGRQDLALRQEHREGDKS